MAIHNLQAIMIQTR